MCWWCLTGIKKSKSLDNVIVSPVQTPIHLSLSLSLPPLSLHHPPPPSLSLSRWPSRDTHTDWLTDGPTDSFFTPASCKSRRGRCCQSEWWSLSSRWRSRCWRRPSCDQPESSPVSQCFWAERKSMDWWKDVLIDRLTIMVCLLTDWGEYGWIDGLTDWAGLYII